uniref:Crossover junction endonuclease MUS81 n=1 Tax=Amphimedon queenslandica TaxID=400682 RepID=A0A1X7VLV8_AMPQE
MSAPIHFLSNGWKNGGTRQLKMVGKQAILTTRRVLYSLKRYPLPINSGQEAKVLEYVGDKVAKKLDERIRDHIASGGKMADLHTNTDEQLPPTKRRQSNSSKPSSTNKTHSDTTGPRTHTEETHTGSNKRKQSNVNDPSDSPLCPSSKRSKSSKEYVPKYRSGPYALLIALIESEQDEEYGKGFMYKNELIDAAQEHCDSSFTVPDEPNSYYTAWSSMANLIKKELVVRSGHPPKFSLTDAGTSLSLRLLEKSKSGMTGLTSSQASSASQSCIDNTRGSQVTTCSQSTSRSLSVSLSPLKLTTPSKRKTISIMDSDDDDDDIVEILPLAQRLGLHKTQRLKSSQTQPLKSSQTQPPKSSQTQPPKSSQTQQPKSSQTLTQSSTMSQVQTEDHAEPRCSQQSLTVIPPLAPSTSSAMPEETTSVDFSSPLFTLRPGQFEVLLCIDNSESSANRKSKANFRGLLLEELTKNGVKFSVRNLNIGDFLWIAKEIVSADPDQLRLPESREIVLDYIIERKRMDDLSDSIIDRRFHEQKFRMKLCGVANPVYLVEDYGDIAHCKVSQRGLYQAITNTQVIDSFFIKQTKDIKGSISYLTIMTRQLQKKYINETIKAFPVETLQQLQKQTCPSKPPFVCGMPFDKFNEASIKNKVHVLNVL